MSERRPRRGRWALWLLTSLATHGLALVALSLGARRGALDAGEEGHGGASGRADEVEVSLVVLPPAPREDSASGAPVDTDAPPTLAAPRAPIEPARPASTPRALGREEPHERSRVVAASEPSASEFSASEPSASEPSRGSGVEPGGASASTTRVRGGGSREGLSPPASAPSARADAVRAILGSAGRLEGDSVSASSLLGEALHCDDPIVGVWVAYRYSPEYRDWARFTLRVRRVGPSLEGSIVARMWRGLPSDRRPPPCTPDGWDYTVTMRASGNLTGDQLAFGASTHEVTRIDCASRFFSYNPDHFTGRLDAFAERLHTVNNDGGRDVDAPYEFRRTSCAP